MYTVAGEAQYWLKSILWQLASWQHSNPFYGPHPPTSMLGFETGMDKLLHMPSYLDMPELSFFLPVS